MVQEQGDPGADQLIQEEGDPGAGRIVCVLFVYGSMCLIIYFHMYLLVSMVELLTNLQT